MVLAMVLSGTIGYFVLQSQQSFWNVVFFRCLIGAITLGVYLYLSSAWKKENLKNQLSNRILLLIVIGGLTLVMNWVLLFASFTYVPFSIATVIYHIQPLFLVLLGAYFTKDTLSVTLFFWLALAFIGLFLMVELEVSDLRALLGPVSSNDETVNLAPLLGALMALSAAFLYTITTLITKQISHISPHLIAFIQVCVGVIVLLPLADFDNLPSMLAPWFHLFVLGVIHTGFMYIIMYDSFQKLSTSLLALLSFIYPVVALFVDFLAFNTLISWYQGAGVMLILIAACAVKFNWGLTFLRRKRV
ncbi:DMT family transporter [Marinomonas agarivorans]|nr:DMT family transporter [Marinomonas agarivorans]